MTFDPDFKQALSELPSKEKDKLLLRLLKKDPNLAQRLHFELVSMDSVEDRRHQMEDRIREETARMTQNFHSPGYLLMDLRYLSGEITAHVRTTKDKFGEISLNLLMLNETLQHNGQRVLPFPRGKTHKWSIYIIARTFKVLMLIAQMHEDLHLEFEDDIRTLGEWIGQNPVLMQTAIYNGLDVNWLIRFDIPEDIADIHKDLRGRGYLK